MQELVQCDALEKGLAEPPIKVAHFIHTMAYGGIETALLNWVQTMDPARFRVFLYCFRNANGSERPFVEAANALGMQVKMVPWHRGKPVFRAVRDLRKLLKEEQIQILHCHNTYADLVGLIAGKLAGAKTVTTLYVWGSFGWIRHALQWMDRLLLPLFDQVTAHCEETFKGTVERGFPAERLRLLPCGFQTFPLVLTAEERKAKRAELGASDSDFVLIHVARFWPEKRHDLLLESFRLILNKRPEAMLWMLGVGPLQQQTEAMAREMGLGNRAAFLGFRTDLAELLASADMQIHPSDMEGVPLAICQGMAQGLPIVATRVGGLTEVIDHGVSGILVERRNPGRCADAVIDLMGDADRRRQLGQSAADFIAKKYSLAAATRRVERVYLDLIVPSKPEHASGEETGDNENCNSAAGRGTESRRSGNLRN